MELMQHHTRLTAFVDSQAAIRAGRCSTWGPRGRSPQRKASGSGRALFRSPSRSMGSRGSLPSSNRASRSAGQAVSCLLTGCEVGAANAKGFNTRLGSTQGPGMARLLPKAVGSGRRVPGGKTAAPAPGRARMQCECHYAVVGRRCGASFLSCVAGAVCVVQCAPSRVAQRTD